MRTKGTSLVLAGTLGLTGLAGGIVLGPAIATAATTEQSAATAVGDRVDRIKEALQGLVDTGTITEQQRDEVAATLNEQLPRGGPGMGYGPGMGRGHGMGPGPGGPNLEAAASTLGMTQEQLRTELRAGKSLADVAGEKNVSVEDLTAALVTAAEERLAQAVTDGKLTQEEADAHKAELSERISAHIQREGKPGNGHGNGGGPGGRFGAPNDESD